MPHVPSLGCPDDVRRERAAGNGPSQRGAVGKCAFPTDGGERRERGRRAGFCPSIYLTSPSPALLCRGAGYTEHVRPSSAAWACQGSQSSSIIPCLHWASSSKTRWQHMCCVPSAENTTRASRFPSACAIFWLLLLLAREEKGHLQRWECLPIRNFSFAPNSQLPDMTKKVEYRPLNMLANKKGKLNLSDAY